MANFQQFTAEFSLGPIKPGDLLIAVGDDAAGNTIIEHAATHYRIPIAPAAIASTSGLRPINVTTAVKHGTSHKT